VKLGALPYDRSQTIMDELLVQRLRALAQRVDPVPGRVRADARSVFTSALGFAPLLLEDIDAGDDHR
jgi:hypothetical protein